MKQMFVIMFTLMSVAVVLSGCWDFSALRDRTIILGIGVDKLEEGYGMALETVQFSDGNEQISSSGKPKVVQVEDPNRSIEIPLHSVQVRLSGHPFYPNLSILAIDKEQAEAGIADIISHFIRDPDMRRSTEVVIVDGSTYELLSIKNDQETFVSNYLDKLVHLVEGTGRIKTADIGDISRAMHEENPILIPLVKVTQNGDEAEVIGNAVMDKTIKWIDRLDVKESRAVGFVKAPEVHDGSLHIDCPQTEKGSVAADIVHSKSELKPKVTEGQLWIEGTVRLRGYLSEYTCGNDRVEGETSIETLENKFSQELTREINETLTVVLRRTGIDVLGLKGIFEKKPVEWRRVEERFDEMLKEAKVNIHMNVELKSKGAES